VRKEEGKDEGSISRGRRDERLMDGQRKDKEGSMVWKQKGQEAGGKKGGKGEGE